MSSSRVHPHVDFRSRSLAWLLLALLSISAAQASVFDRLGGNDGPLDVEQAYRFSAIETALGVYQLSWDIEPDYYLYRDKIKITGSDQVEVIETRYAEAQPKQDPLFGEVLVYHDQARLSIRVRSLSTEPVNDELNVQYQGCWEGGICYPPVNKQFTINQVPNEPASFTPLAAALASAGPVTDGPALSLTDQRQFATALASGDLLLILGLFLVAGLALSLTPCVFPMVPILAGVIAGQKNNSPGRAFWMSVVYVLAMAITYTLAGIFAGLFGENLQAAFQAPWVIISFSLLFVVFAASMFGFFQLQVPHGLQNRLNRLSRSQQGGEAAGVAVMGFLSALIVGPCVAAPLAGALVFIGQTGDPVLGGMALFVLSLGMGLPLILVGTSAGKLLPKAGTWMKGVKSGFGVVMLLMAVWMLDRIVSTPVTMALTGVILVISAIYLQAIDPLPAAASGLQRFGKGVGVLLLIYGGALLVGAAGGNRSLVYPLQGFAGTGSQSQQLPQFTTVNSYAALEPLLLKAKAENTPVMLDFYADWCVSCVELEFFTFADPAVQQQMQRFALIKVDVTANDQAAKALYQRYNIIGPPALVFYDRQGALLAPKMLVGVPTPKDFSEHLKQI